MNKLKTSFMIFFSILLLIMAGCKSGTKKEVPVAKPAKTVAQPASFADTTKAFSIEHVALAAKAAYTVRINHTIYTSNNKLPQADSIARKD